MRPVLLDLFAGAGGAAVGYRRAGFDIVGVDIKPQRHYPFTFIQADAMDVLQGRHWHLPLNAFAAIHCSPPCQSYLRGGGTKPENHPDLVNEVRELLKTRAWGVPYVIENTELSPLWHPVMLCGVMFGLGVFRHRFFELGWKHDIAPVHPHHYGQVGDGRYFTVTGHTGRGSELDQWAQAMGIDWMSTRELAQAIPPAYTEWIGMHLIVHLDQTGRLDR